MPQMQPGNRYDIDSIDHKLVVVKVVVTKKPKKRPLLTLLFVNIYESDGLGEELKRTGWTERSSTSFFAPLN
jgi:hypothetical protein